MKRRNKKYMKNLKLILLMVIAFLTLSSVKIFAQDLTGKWQGTLLWSGNAGVKDEVYDWEQGKWLNTTRTPTRFALELEKGEEDGKYTGLYIYNISDVMKFDSTFSDTMLKGASGAGIKGGRRWSGYVELNYREQDGKKYLEGSWRTYENTKFWEGRVALRLVEDE